MENDLIQILYEVAHNIKSIALSARQLLLYETLREQVGKAAQRTASFIRVHLRSIILDILFYAASY